MKFGRMLKSQVVELVDVMVVELEGPWLFEMLELLSPRVLEFVAVAKLGFAGIVLEFVAVAKLEFAGIVLEFVAVAKLEFAGELVDVGDTKAEKLDSRMVLGLLALVSVEVVAMVPRSCRPCSECSGPGGCCPSWS